MVLKNKKRVLIIIIILLFIAFPLALGGLVLKLLGMGDDSTKINIDAPANPNFESKYLGYLYYYDENSVLKGAYKCQNPNAFCDFAEETIDDDTFAINFYDDQTVDKISLINERYIFIYDSSSESTKNVILYNLKDNRTIATYSSVKNYTVGIDNNIFIVRTIEGRWGVISLADETPKPLINFDYEFIGLSDKKTTEGKIAADNFVVKNERGWFIIDRSNAELSSPIASPIKDYNGEYIITKNNDRYYSYKFDGAQILDPNGFKDLSFTGKYINILNDFNMLYVYDPETNIEITPRLNVPSGTDYAVSINNNKIEVNINGTINSYDI